MMFVKERKVAKSHVAAKRLLDGPGGAILRWEEQVTKRIGRIA